MNKGKIVEQGTHLELMNKDNGYYAKLVNLQSLDRE
jgi:ABC-type multidrug transport system fused ATPase/permease subunit